MRNDEKKQEMSQKRAFDRIQLSTKPEFDGEREDNFDLGRRADLEIIGQGARGRVCEDRRKERKWAGVESAQSATTMIAQEHPIGEGREKQVWEKHHSAHWAFDLGHCTIRN